MIKIKLCGLTRSCDIQAANLLKPDYIGFVFARKSCRYVSPEKALALTKELLPEIKPVGVFADEKPEVVAGLLNDGLIYMAQLHGREDGAYIKRLRRLTGQPIMQAFQILTEKDTEKVKNSLADYVLLDSGGGTGRVFDWRWIRNVERPYFLAGGLDSSNVREAIETLQPYGVDVSSGIETDGYKDQIKMAEFVAAVRKEAIE